MGRKAAPKHKFAGLFVNPGRIVEAIQREDEHTIPIRQIKILFPIYSVEAFGELKEEAEYELLELFIERGIAECELNSAHALNTFFGLKHDPSVIEKMLDFLRAIDHITGPNDQLALTKLGEQSLEIRRSCRVLKTQRIFYFDAFTLSPLKRDYYDLRFLSAAEALELSDPNIYRLSHEGKRVRFWDDRKMYELAEKKPDERVKYNLPRGIKITDVKPQGVVYLPISIIETHKYDSTQSTREYTAITSVRGFKDNYFTELINGDDFTQEALRTAAESQQKSVEMILKEWLQGQPIAPFAHIVQNEKRVWQLHIQRDAFKQSHLSLNPRDIGDYKLANGYFVQYWCDDRQLRHNVALEQIIRILDRQRRQGTLAASIVERVFERSRQHLQLDSVKWESFRSYALAHKKEELLELLEDIMTGSSLLKEETQQQQESLDQADEEQHNGKTISALPAIEETDKHAANGSHLEQESEPQDTHLHAHRLSRAGRMNGTRQGVDWHRRTMSGAKDESSDMALLRPKPLGATWDAYGSITTDARRYRPLDTITVHLHGRREGDEYALISVCDSNQQAYYETLVPLQGNQGTVHFSAAGTLGVHSIYLFWLDEKEHSRYLNFLVECETAIESGNPDFDTIYPLSHELMQLGRREYQFPDGKFVGYVSADTWSFDSIHLRDWIYGLPASKYWERDMDCGLAYFLEAQSEEGRIPGAIECNDEMSYLATEPDTISILVIGVWQTWLTTGDDDWLWYALPQLERALKYVHSCYWDTQHNLVKRQHSCDTWGFDIDGVEPDDQERQVIATCDQTGYYQAFQAMGQMYHALGNEEHAALWAEQAELYRQRAVELLWDGQKFLHHVHLSPIDHGDFDETQQLAMSNTWAITRGLASTEQSQAIIEEYRRRHATTGDVYPWWSLQPGYPNELGYFASPSCQRGGYANGGLMPWVGGELCLGAFRYDRARYAIELLRQYADHLHRTGGAHAWYWPNGEAGFRTTNEVPYASWGLAQWVNALMEGLAGLHDTGGCWQEVTITPRWVLANIHTARIYARYACNQSYIAYHLHVDYHTTTLTINYSGSGRQASFHILLPDGWNPARVVLNEQPILYERRQSEDGLYLIFDAPICGVGNILIVGT